MSVRFAQLYLKHNRPWDDITGHTQLPMLVKRVDNYRTVDSLADSDFRLPMSQDKDFVWSDPEVGVVVFKHDNVRCWMVMNWRGPGINRLARVHYTTDDIDRIANIQINVLFTPSGESITRPTERGNVFVYPGGGNTYTAIDLGELPLADGPLAHQGNFYYARYGNYVILMNTTSERSVSARRDFSLEDLRVKSDSRVRDIETGEIVALKEAVIPPDTTQVLELHN